MAGSKKIELTEKEKEIVNRLDDSLYTVEFLEEWVNNEDSVDTNIVNALQACTAKGFYTAVKRMALIKT